MVPSSSKSFGIIDEGITAIAHGCPALEMIKIAYNDKITDTSLISLSKCMLLKVLEIQKWEVLGEILLSSHF